MSFGTKLANTRRLLGMTQEKLAEQIGVSTEAVSKWERDRYSPDPDKLARLDEVLDLPLRDKNGELQNARFFHEDHMSAYLKGKLNATDYPNALAALQCAKDKHAGAVRKGPAKVPYINHPLTMACHALALGLTDDALLAALLLHDVSEDCFVAPEDLPVCKEAQEIVRLVTKPKDRTHFSDKEYYKAISAVPKASLVKCIDRCNNLSSMPSGMTDMQIASYVRETEKYYPELLRVVKACPEYNSAAWLLTYQMRSLMAMAKRIRQIQV